MPEQPLTIDVDVNSYSIKVIYQNGIYNFTAQNEDEFPSIQRMGEQATMLSMPANILGDCISRSIFATATEELRPVMNGIYFDLSQDALAIVASDGHNLV